MNNFYLRLLLVLFIGFFVAAAIANGLFPSMTSSHRDAMAVKLAAELAQKMQAAPPVTPAPDNTAAVKGKKARKSPPAAPKKLVLPKASLPILESIIDNHLSWYYLTDGSGRLIPQTKTFAPDLQQYDEDSRFIDWSGERYYEAVALVVPGYALHVGYYSGPPIGLSREIIDEQIPSIVVFGMFAFMALLVIGLYIASVSMPMAAIKKYCKKRDDASGMTTGSMSAPGAVSEILTAMSLIESKYRALDERDETIRNKDNTIKQLNNKFEQEMNAAKKEKSVLYLKEAEHQFVDNLGETFDTHTNIDTIGESLLTQLNNEFPSAFEYALFFTINKKQEANLVSHIGFQNNPMEVYKGLGVMKNLKDIDAESCVVVEPNELTESQFKEISQLTGARCVIKAPLRFQNRCLGLMVVFFRGQDQSLEHIVRVLNRAAHVTAKALYHIITYEEQVEASRTDELTGYPNKAYIPHLLPQLMSVEGVPNGEKRPFSIFLVEGHDVLSINEKFGRPAGDAVIQELGKRIDKLLQQRRTETMGSWGDHLIRYQGAQFLVVLRQVDSKKASIFAQRLRQVVEGEDYPFGVGRWNISIGITSYPEDSSNPDELIMNVETALSYARGQSERNKIAHINTVPKAFRSAKIASNLGGSLDVFDPAALMQSLSISRKSGILTVTHPEGKMYWCFLENGKPTKARMGKFTGPAAIIEFLVLFESGEFAFSDLTSIEKQTLDDISKLPKAFDVPGSLERALMDGALARDHYTSAKDVIKDLNLFAWPQPSAKNGEGMAKLKELKDPPSPEEEKAMKEILKVANGKVQLKLIFERLDSLPTHTVWRAAALMVQHDMLQLKKLATSMAL
ncbi:MAG: diguanylate cyclase [Candidatus Obscuribacterales bacterium]|nr:diguanylate cyclase [Candidatus Obscuribacterales bacterium]